MLIAALIYTKSYTNAVAQTYDCHEIPNYGAAENCYRNWETKFNNEEFTYGEWQANGFSESDYSTCYAWSDDRDQDTGELKYEARCEEVYWDELASYCCEYAGITGTNNYACTSTLEGINQCSQAIEYIDCADEINSERMAEYDGISDIVSDYIGGCYTKQELDLQGFNTANICLTDWEQADCEGSAYEEGNVQSCAKCCNMDEDSVKWQLCQQAGDPNECWKHMNNLIQCMDSQEPDISCGSGSYLNASKTGCVTCPAYELYDGSEFSEISSDDGATSDKQCYVPKNIEFCDETGCFTFIQNCYHSGS